MADEGIELKSPFPVVPPLKDSKWGELPKSADAESHPLDRPTLHPNIGEPHPCPYFRGPEMNFVNPRKDRPPPKKEEEEENLFHSYLNECIHGAAWECVSNHSQDMSKEMFCALISSNPRKFTVSKDVFNSLRKKLLKKSNDPKWSEPCEPIDSMKIDVLTCQAYKLSKARYTLTNEALTDFHRKTVSRSVSQKLTDLYGVDMEKKLKKYDSKKVKQQPPRIAS